MRWAASAATVLALLAVAAPAAAQQHEHGPLRPDSDAPAGAPPHWIPPEQWVFNHWLPYDEARLLRLLRVDRAALWAHLRDDRRSLAGLAAARGWRVGELARALVAPRGATGAHRRSLEARARRTLTQGHLAQHVLFHTLHQEVLPQRAQRIFGVSSARFRTLRRGDLSPLEIARGSGRGRAQVTAAADAALVEMARRGVAQGAVSRRQADLVLDRQRRQLHRWLEHRRYNGPPPTDEEGRLEGPLLPHALAPSITDDGALVAFEQAQPAVPLAAVQGEIAVQLRRAADGAPAMPGPAPPTDHAPCSAYASQVAGGGGVAVLETAAGNRTFAKRYGEPQVVRVDLRTGAARALSPRGATAYHPAVSADGRVVAFTVVRDRGPAAQVAVRRAGTGTTVLDGMAHEPALSGDGWVLALVRLHHDRATAVVRDLRTGRERRVRTPGGDAAQPVLSRDGRTVAVTAGRTVHVERDGRAVALPRIAGRGLHSPALSPDGRTLAVAVLEGGAAGAGGRPRQGLALVDLDRGSARRVPVAEPYAAHPALGDRTLAHTVAGADGVQRVVVRDLATGAVRQVSAAPGPEAALAAPCRAEPPVW